MRAGRSRSLNWGKNSSLSAQIEVLDGSCYVFFAFDVGLSIDLPYAAQTIPDERERMRFRHSQKAPIYFEYDPPPVRVTQRSPRLNFGLATPLTEENVEITIFDFGGISVCYSIDIRGVLIDLVSLSAVLYENALLLADARRRVQELCARIALGIDKYSFSELYENYALFELRRLSADLSPPACLETYAPVLGQILRCEDGPLSEGEIQEALSHRLSYLTSDAVLIDWNAAVFLGSEAQDVRAVLEFANLELVEMRYLDEQLDDALEQAYQAMTQGGRTRTDLNRVARLQVDAAILFEAVNNVLKLLGDQYLARVYSLVSKRFHLADWDASILRKLDTLNSIYEKISDSASNKKMQLLEWIIILLFVLDILISLLER